MRLLVTDRVIKERLDCQVIEIYNFNDLAYHPYIQSVDWESVIIDLDERIVRGYIKQILGRKVKIVPYIIKDEITPKQLLLLCEIYPDRMSEIFSWSNLRHDEKIAKVNGLSEIYHWSIEYWDILEEEAL